MKLAADYLMEYAPLASLVLACLFALGSAERFAAYLRLGPSVVYWSEWVLLAVGSVGILMLSGFLYALARRWIYG